MVYSFIAEQEVFKMLCQVPAGTKIALPSLTEHWKLSLSFFGPMTAMPLPLSILRNWSVSE